MWRKTLEYLGLVEEAEEYDELPERREAHGSDVRPAMHDTTGPIDVVRVDDASGDSRRGRAADAGQLRPVRDPGDSDLTEPVSVVDGERGGRSSPVNRRAPAAGTANAVGNAPARPGRSRGDHDAGNVRQLRPEGAGFGGSVGRRVAIVAVADYEGGAREVGQRCRQSVPVVFDLTDAPTDDRRRVLDFVAGVTYALHGEMVKVGPRSFLIVPQGGEVPDAEWDRLAGLGYRP